MFCEQNEQHDSSWDKQNGDGDGTDAVEYGSCQHPVVLHLILLVCLITLLFLFVNPSFQKTTHSLQQLPRLRVFRRSRWRHGAVAVVNAVVYVAATDIDTPDLSVDKWRRFQWLGGRRLHAQACCKSLAEQILQLAQTVQYLFYRGPIC